MRPLVGFAVATAGVDNTIRADARFYWYLDLRVFQQYLRNPAVPSGTSAARSSCRGRERRLVFDPGAAGDGMVRRNQEG